MRRVEERMMRQSRAQNEKKTEKLNDRNARADAIAVAFEYWWMNGGDGQIKMSIENESQVERREMGIVQLTTATRQEEQLH